MQFSAVEIRFIVTTYLYSTFANDFKRKYFVSKNVHSYRVCSFKGFQYTAGFVQKWENRIPGLFSFFMDSISSQFCIKQREKNPPFLAVNIEMKRRTRFIRF